MYIPLNYVYPSKNVYPSLYLLVTFPPIVCLNHTANIGEGFPVV